jgi:hypothetical protein
MTRSSRAWADVDKTCGLDVPLAASYVELHDIENERHDGQSVKTSCFGLKVALADFGAVYKDNPVVTDITRKYAAWCNVEGVDQGTTR